MTNISPGSSKSCQTIIEVLLAAPPERRFVTMWKSEEDAESVTFGQFLRRASAQAAYLKSLGAQAGDTIILVLPQGIPLMTAFAGAMLLGCVPAILAYPNFKVDPAKYRFGLTGVSANLNARLILIDEDFPEHLTQRISGSARLVRCPPEDTAGPSQIEAPPIESNHLAFIQHSAGTTGLQKGVALSHEAVLIHLKRLAAALQISPEDRIYSWLPLYHDMGLVACFMLPMVTHVPVVMQSPIDWVMQPSSMLDLISAYRCTLAWVPNFTLQFLSRRVRMEEAGLDLSTLRAVINCSEPVRASSMNEFLETFKKCGLRDGVLHSSYAMAETVFAVTQSDVSGDGPRRVWINGEVFRKEKRILLEPSAREGAMCLVSSGSCLPKTEVMVVSDDGKELGPGFVGEILIKSDSMLTGYYNRPDLTDKALRGGWYWSGDLGFALDGDLYVVGRKKDLIIVAGENIYPQDIEEIVSSNPAIYDGRVVAFGQFNPGLGTEEVVVVAEVRDESHLGHSAVIDQQLRTAISSELGVRVGAIYLKPPRWIIKSTAGKPARSTTREKLVSEHAELQLQGGVG